MYIKEDLYYVWEDDRMTRDGDNYTKREIIEGYLTHLVLEEESGILDDEGYPTWEVMIEKGQDVHETPHGDFVVLDKYGDIENIRKDKVSISYPEEAA